MWAGKKKDRVLICANNNNESKHLHTYMCSLKQYNPWICVPGANVLSAVTCPTFAWVVRIRSQFLLTDERRPQGRDEMGYCIQDHLLFSLVGLGGKEMHTLGRPCRTWREGDARGAQEACPFRTWREGDAHVGTPFSDLA
jgi:polyferredoxin